MTTESQLVDYLLGRLRDPEAERLDEASLVDDAIASRLRAVENDLVDAYVRGTLRGETLARFEGHYLSSPVRRDNVAFARRFARAIDRASVATPAPAAPFVFAHRTMRKLSMAAAIVVAACSVALLREAARPGGGAAAGRPLSSVGAEGADIPRQTDLRAVRDAAPDGRRLPAARIEPPASPAAAAVALVLLPQTRAVGPVPALRVPLQTGRVTFELRLEGGERGTYVVALRDPSVNRLVWRTRATSTAGGALTVVVPASILRAQHYSLDLFADGAASDADVLGSYVFEIASR